MVTVTSAIPRACGGDRLLINEFIGSGLNPKSAFTNVSAIGTP